MIRHSKINWSDIARTAFEYVITREERAKAIGKITEMLEEDNTGWDGVKELRKWRKHHQ